ncbi:MAG: type II toxin-antitoxin system RelE/ParE family toxin [Eubacterium sp.]|nr:type II toxin-antitoxin system RelE/ParE family toxin [Eubacterium sp.]
MDLFDVIIAPEAYEQLSAYIHYIKYVLMNETAAEKVYNDAIETGNSLALLAGSLPFCENEKLKQYGYRTIAFKRHQYIMVYRIEGNIAYVDGIIHQKQDYENIFVKNK